MVCPTVSWAPLRFAEVLLVERGELAWTADRALLAAAVPRHDEAGIRQRDPPVRLRLRDQAALCERAFRRRLVIAAHACIIRECMRGQREAILRLLAAEERPVVRFGGKMVAGSVRPIEC